MKDASSSISSSEPVSTGARAEFRRLVLRGGAFIAPVLVIVCGVEVGLSRVDNVYAAKRTRLIAAAPKVEVILTGSSHVASGLDPNALGLEAFNLAHPSQTIYYDTRLILNALPRLPALKLVILGISFHALEYQMDDCGEPWLQYFYSRIDGIPPRTSEARWALANYSYIAMYGPTSALHHIRARFQRNIGGNIDARGWDLDAPSLPMEDLGPRSGAKAVAYHLGFMKESHIEENIKDLERLIAILKSHGIAVALLTPPVHPSYSMHIPKVRYEKMQRAILGLAQVVKVPYWNFFRDSRFGEGDFRNVSHLSASGAAKFGALVGREALDSFRTLRFAESPR